MPEFSYKTRKRLSLAVLFIWLPLYIIGVVILLASLPRLPILLETLIYIMAGILWVLPFKFVFLGVGKPDPNKPAPKYLDDDAIASEKIKQRQFRG